MLKRRTIVAVIGNARITDPIHYQHCCELGSALVQAGYRIVTGGLGGVMEAVSKGAQSSPQHFDGSVIGIVPSYQASEANEYCDIVIPTGMQLARNILVVATGDAVVVVGGGSGTLSEMALAWQLGKPVLALGSKGWGGELAGRSLDNRRPDTISECDDIPSIIKHLNDSRCAPIHPLREIGKGGRHS
jgi:uncharacterized protein (TIGR00725 family)